MKRLARFLIHIYPPAWRERYGREFEALVEETNTTWQHLTDIALEALKMRLTAINYRFAAAMSLLGLVVAMVVAFQLPERYLASATLRVRPNSLGNTTQAFAEANRLIGRATSRTALGNLILSPDLKLYDEERRTKRLEEVIANMKARDLRLTTASDGALTVSYHGRSMAEAAGTVRHIVDQLRADHAGEAFKNGDVGTTPSSPSRTALAVTGLLAGLGLAGLLAFIREAPKVWLFASAGLALLTGATWLLPVPWQATSTIILDGGGTRTALIADPVRLVADLQNQARVLGGGSHSFYGLDLQPEAIPTLLTIRARHTDPHIAYDLVQITITRFIDKTRRKAGVLEVVNPPDVPTAPMGRASCEVILAVSIFLTFLSGVIVITDKPRPQLTLQPV